jgi:LPS O-antigen subunit length determinant protein (WzzB/FepE family)
MSNPPREWTAAYEGEEIDLYDLGVGLWRRRGLIAGITGVMGLFAALYVFGIATDIYRAEAKARPPSASMLLPINEALTLRGSEDSADEDSTAPYVGIATHSALERVVFEARAQDMQIDVLNAHIHTLAPDRILAHTDPRETARNLLPAISITVGGLGKNDVLSEPTLTVSFEHGRPEAAATLANALLAEANQRAVAAAVADTKAALDSRLSQLRADLKQAEVDATRAAQDEIARLEEADERRRRELAGQLKALRTKAQKLRADRIQQLEEALAIAQELGLEDPQSVELSARSLNVSEAARAPSINLAVSGGQEYLKGARLLNAELTAVKSRTSEDAFTPEVRELEANLALLESNPRIELLKARDNPLAFVDRARELRASIERLERAAQRDFSSVQFMQLDQPAVVPTRPIRPRRSVIMVAALFTGLMLGVLVALVMNATEARRRAAAEQGASA